MQKCPCDGFRAVAQKSMFIFNRMPRRGYPVFAQTLRSNSKKEKTGFVAKKCYPQKYIPKRWYILILPLEFELELIISQPQRFFKEFSIRPVCTGMSLKKKLFVSVGEDPPRMHGDEPWDVRLYQFTHGSASYVRGWTDAQDWAHCFLWIRPVCTGMNLSLESQSLIKRYLPCMHGDEPMKLEAMKHQGESAPYTRGWTLFVMASQSEAHICPVYTG